MVRASDKASRTVPTRRPLVVLLTFTGNSTTSPSRKKRGGIGSTIKSFEVTHVSKSVPLRICLSCASALNCQVVSVSGKTNSSVTLPALFEIRVGIKKAVSTILRRGGGGAE